MFSDIIGRQFRVNCTNQLIKKFMQKYEVAVLIKPLLPEDIKQKVLPAIADLATKLGGKTAVSQDWGKKHLAYPINGHEEGYYLFLNAEMAPAMVVKFERELRLMRDILRFLVIREDQV
jgi:small subunit ribosomal protein S6